MVATTRPTPALTALALALASLAAACVEPPPTLSGSDNPLVDRLGCLGQTPACLSACSAGRVLAGASCEAGVWRCETGVREDLCCDAVADPTSCPTWGAPCAADDPCAAGYSCVRSRAFPLPVDAGEAGLCRLGEWSVRGFDQCASRDALVWPEALITQRDIGPVQVEGVVAVAPLCDDRRCTPDDPCCQQCTGSYTLELATSDHVAFAVSLRTETTACGGTNCGFSCAPLQPGRRYRIWGVWDPTDGGGSGTLFYAGHCDD